MQIGVIGLGSMGKRRVRDLLALGHRVVGLDEREDRRKEATDGFGIAVTQDFRGLCAEGIEAAVISTPPDEHLAYYEQCFGARIPFFSEANVLTPTAEWFAERERASGVRSFPSATWQFYPLFGVLKDWLELSGSAAINTVHYHYGGFLPLWHPWEP